MPKRKRPLWWAALKIIFLALLVLLAGLAPYPHALVAAMRQAEAHRATSAYGAALETYRRAARLAPDWPLPWLRTGQVLLVQHRFPEATDAYRQAGRLGAGLEAVLGLGDSFAGQGDWAQALSTWYRALALAPRDPRIHLALARGHLAQGRFQQAEASARQALSLASEPGRHAAVETQAHALLGRLLAGREDAAALDHLRRAGEADLRAAIEVAAAEPEPARQALLLGAAFLQRDELPLARHHFERAAAPESAGSQQARAEALAYLAHTLDRLGETVQARERLEQALALDAESAPAYYFLGIHERRVGNLQGARDALWQALQWDPDNAALRAEMARAYEEEPDYALAEEWYQGAVDAAPDDAGFRLLLAQFYVNHLYRIEEAGVPAAEAAVIAVPSEPRAYDLLGWAYALAGRTAEAEAQLAWALDRDPGLVSAHFHLGSLYLRTGRPDLARQHLQRAADLDTGGILRARAEALLLRLD
ncbi:MAG: tetratricopeptide repeat protein [Anaerolineae bacterium]|jgi:tetratricopeptide (TPR) repeat protein